MIDLITLALAKKAGGGGSGGVTPEQMAAAIHTAIADALADYTPSEDVGSDVSVSMDSSYNLTVSLENAVGDTLGEGEVNLPLESMVVGGAYADGVLTLTLKNSQTIDIPISDIIDGLVSESRTIAGIPLTSDIEADELREAIGGQKNAEYIACEWDIINENITVTDERYNDGGIVDFERLYADVNDWLAEGMDVYLRTEFPDFGMIVDLKKIAEIPEDSIVFCTDFSEVILTVYLSEDGMSPFMLDMEAVEDIQEAIDEEETSVLATVGAIADYAQKKITSDNKLPYSLLSGTPTNLVTGYNNTAYTMRPITQADYNALGTKDANTLYLITG